jgi:folate-binding protein YgfZ
MTTQTINTGSIRTETVWLDVHPQFGLVQITGKDREPFLQALTSNDIVSLPTGSGQRNAALDKRSFVLHDFLLFKTAESLLLLTRTDRIPDLLKHLDGFLFAEQVEMSDCSGAFRVLAIQGSDAWSSVKPWLPPLYQQEEMFADKVLENEEQDPVCWVFSHSITGDPGYLLAAPVEKIDALKEELSNMGIKQVEWQDLETQRIESGYLEWGIDFGDKTMIQTLNLGDKILNLNKGCYPGQEIVARVTSRSEVKQKLLGLEFNDSAQEPANIGAGHTLIIAGKTAGSVKRAVFSPLFGKTLAIAQLGKNEAVPGKVLEFQVKGMEDVSYKAKVVKLPFYVSQHIANRAAAAYDEGMTCYHGNRYEEAIEQFDHALEIHPDFSDAMEAKAMTLEKMDRIDEAIELNKAFARMDPDAVMAHTNLSRLYMLKGWKDRAEKEMAQATMLRFRQVAREKGQDDTAMLKQQEEAERAERERKRKMFQQVLELDPEDEIANFGLGKIQLESGEYEQAESSLKTVIRNNPDYSAAYEALVKALRSLGKIEEAIDTAQTGIEKAEKQGNLMPANNMRKDMAEMKGTPTS